MPTLHHDEPRATSARVLAACFNLAVALRVLMPDEILGNPHNHGYRLINVHFFGDIPFGLMLLLYGGVMLVGLRTDRWPMLMHVATWLSLLTWTLVAVDIAIVNFSQIGSLVYALVAFLNGYAYLHLVLRQRDLGRER